MRAKDFIPPSKPRNPVVRQQQTSGAGAHRDKKKEQKQGYEKHKGRGVSEGFFGIDDNIKGKIQNIVSDLSDIPGMWDHKAQTFTDVGMDKLKTVLKNNPKYIKYAINLTADDFDEGVSEGSHTTEKQILTRIRQIMYDRKVSGTESNAGELNRLKQQLKDIRNQQGVAEGWGQREFKVDGYTYMTDIDEEEDNRKIWHMLKTPEGETINVDFTPYAYMSKEDVELYIKLGMPKRQGVGPLDTEQLQKMAQIKGVAMLDPKMAKAGL
jgi:hypothetical protein